jgi:hypothetical protein
MAHVTDESAGTSALPPYTERPPTADAARWSRVYESGRSDSDIANRASRRHDVGSPVAPRESGVSGANGLKNIGDGSDCLQGVRWSSDSWAQQAARRQESVPPVPVGGDKERVIAWSVPAW